jgi:negative regulator of genetic competence, sporulation and motility
VLLKMQIDVLSQNTLKLTLSRLDMFDLDIKYESLSGKNPDTKRLLSHVLRTVKLDKSSGVDFSGERLFVEAFPRPDGGCMLYISSLNEDGNIEKKAVRLSAKPSPQLSSGRRLKPKETQLLCRFDSLKGLEGVCRNLSWQQAHKRTAVTSSLYTDGSEYRLLVTCDDTKLINTIVGEYGEILDCERDLAHTREYYKLLAANDAVERLV